MKRELKEIKDIYKVAVLLVLGAAPTRQVNEFGYLTFSFPSKDVRTMLYWYRTAEELKGIRTFIRVLTELREEIQTVKRAFQEAQIKHGGEKK